jgi:hypothetical protein
MELLSALFLLLSLPAAAADLKVDFAYRNASSSHEADRRTITLQGSRASGDTHLDSVCASAAACDCLLYRTANDAAPLLGTGLTVSHSNNTVACRVPGNSADTALFVKLQQRGSNVGNTGLIAISTALTLDQVLGVNLKKEQVREISRYSCTRTFFEGEGVNQNFISCVAGQHLGVITASYNFYIYRSSVDSNNPGSDVAFPADICKRNNFLKIQCTGNAPELRYGFYRTNEGPFVVGISMTRAPEAAAGDTQPLTDIYGYAALPDESGICAPGLVSASPWVAQPASILPRGPACPSDGCPSSFINQGQLNNTQVETLKPVNFQVSRAPNLNPCSISAANAGDCTNATFQGAQAAQSINYTSLTPRVCVISPSLLSGLN